MLGQVDEALRHYETALRHQPDHAWAHFNRSQVWLLQGDWARGWDEWEWRWRRPGTAPRAWDVPAWDGTPLPGGTVLLHAEQGMGDTLQFVRFVRETRERVSRVVLECQPALLPLLRGVPEVDQLVAKGLPLPRVDAQVALLSLPRLFGARPDSIPGKVPYLQADPERVAKWRTRLAAYPGFKVGIAWQGNPKYKRDRFRSVPLAEFAPLAAVPGVHLIGLQKGPGREQLTDPAPFPVVDLGPDVDEAGAFLDTAAIMKNLDLVITSDTSIPHLAGGLGVPTWVALGSSPDWRWLLNRVDSP